MALIKCPECGTEVSSLAESCPKCAYPIASGGSTQTQAHGGKIQTIERTSKRYKAQLLWGWFFEIVGIILMIVGGFKNIMGIFWFGVSIFCIALLWLIVVRFQIWWHHG